MSGLTVSFHTDPKGWPWPASWWRLRRTKHRFDAGRALRHGVAACGDTVIAAKPNVPVDADVAVIWSWKQPAVIAAQRQRGKHVLVLERGFIQPRTEWVSLGFDGFNGRGHFPAAQDGGARWDRHFGHWLKPWRESGGNRALLIGQVPGDAALAGLDIAGWAQTMTDQLVAAGFAVTYRPHPERPTPCPSGAGLSALSLEADLAAADRVVTFNSTTAVEAVLAGVPTVVMDEGSVATALASREPAGAPVTPDRTKWCHDLAFRQWTLAELADGSAWRHARQYLVRNSSPD